MKPANAMMAFRFGFGPVRAGGAFDPENDIAAGKAAKVPEPRPSQERLQKYMAMSRNVSNSASPASRLMGRRDVTLVIHADLFRDTHDAIVEAVTTAHPFVSRLSAFWANHFSFGGNGVAVRGTCGVFEREALRPNMFGYFEDLLTAAETYPAMVVYLNLQQSIGPNSPAGRRRGGGLNENLGREVLELHTLGIDGGYDQNDVTELSKIMTGWSVNHKEGLTGFSLGRAEPGSKQLLGKTIGGARPSADDYMTALSTIAQHPSTARFIGRKLARHFIGPSEDRLEKELTAVFSGSKGYLPDVYAAMIQSPEANSPRTRRARTDFEFLVSALRAGNLKPDALIARQPAKENLRANPATDGAMAQLTQKLWLAPSPKGWPEETQFWLSAPVLEARLRIIPRLIGQMLDTDPLAFAEAALGPLATPNTMSTLKLASNRRLALGLVLASPEFHRR